MKNLLFSTIVFFCLSIPGYAQLHHAKAHQAQTALKIGDQVPDLTIGGTRLSTLYQHGGLIINFWATWCAPCITELPTLNALAKKFSAKLKIISVAYEDSTVVSRFLKQHRGLDLSALSLITNDTLLIEYLKHSGLPYNVWIDSTGTIRHITHGDEINEENIKAFIGNGTLKMHEVKEVKHWDFTKPFHLKDSSYQYRSIITGHTDGILSGYYIYRVGKTYNDLMISRIFVFNLSISQLYRIAYTQTRTPASMMDYYNTVEFRTKDSILYFPPKMTSNFFKASKYRSRDDWAEDHTFCYELTLAKPVKESEAFAYMLQDLQRTFHLNAAVVNERRLCMVITLSDAAKHALFKRSTQDSSILKITDKGIVAQNIGLDRLFENLNMTIRPTLTSKPIDPPYINDTGINYPIDLSLEHTKEKPDYDKVKTELEKKYGFRFKLEERNYPILVVNDQNL